MIKARYAAEEAARLQLHLLRDSEKVDEETHVQTDTPDDTTDNVEARSTDLLPTVPARPDRACEANPAPGPAPAVPARPARESG